jgi:hypothetical protein
MKFYLAGNSKQPWRDIWRRVADGLEAAGHTCSHRWFDPHRFDTDGTELALELDKIGISMADIFIGIYDKDCRGALWEGGYAQGRGLPVIAVILVRDGEGTDGICDFVLHGRRIARINFDPVRIDGLAGYLVRYLEEGGWKCS